MIGAAAVHPLPCHTTTRPAAASSAAGGLAAGLQQPGLLLLLLRRLGAARLHRQPHVACTHGNKEIHVVFKRTLLSVG